MLNLFDKSSKNHPILYSRKIIHNMCVCAYAYEDTFLLKLYAYVFVGMYRYPQSQIPLSWSYRWFISYLMWVMGTKLRSHGRA